MIGKNLISALSLKIDGKSLTVNSCDISSKSLTVNSCDISNKVNPNGTSSICTVATEFPDLFTDDIGFIKGFKHKIKVYPDVKPVQHKLRRIPLSVRDAVSRELQKFQDADIIEPVNEASEWISPTVVAFESSGDIRLCVDLRTVNKAIITHCRILMRYSFSFVVLLTFQSWILSQLLIN